MGRIKKQLHLYTADLIVDVRSKWRVVSWPGDLVLAVLKKYNGGWRVRRWISTSSEADKAKLVGEILHGYWMVGDNFHVDKLWDRYPPSVQTEGTCGEGI